MRLLGNGQKIRITRCLILETLLQNHFKKCNKHSSEVSIIGCPLNLHRFEFHQCIDSFSEILIYFRDFIYIFRTINIKAINYNIVLCRKVELWNKKDYIKNMLY